MKLLSMFVVIIFSGSLSLQASEPLKQKRQKKNRAPIIKSFVAADRRVILCPFGSGCEVVSSDPNGTTLLTTASDPDSDHLTYAYSVTAGKIEGKGSEVRWNLEKSPGDHQVEVVVTDSKGNKARAVLNVTASWCTTCDPPPPPCPAVTVSFVNKSIRNP